MRFYQGTQFPAAFRDQLLVAKHGSWNRSAPQGYQVVWIKFDASGNPIAEESFISGWLQTDGSVIGRPVDLLTLPNGSLLISDDQQGLIYKVSYDPQPK